MNSNRYERFVNEMICWRFLAIDTFKDSVKYIKNCGISSVIYIKDSGIYIKDSFFYIKNDIFGELYGNKESLEYFGRIGGFILLSIAAYYAVEQYRTFLHNNLAVNETPASVLAAMIKKNIFDGLDIDFTFNNDINKPIIDNFIKKHYQVMWNLEERMLAVKKSKEKVKYHDIIEFSKQLKEKLSCLDEYREYLQIYMIAFKKKKSIILSSAETNKLLSEWVRDFLDSLRPPALLTRDRLNDLVFGVAKPGPDEEESKLLFGLTNSPLNPAPFELKKDNIYYLYDMFQMDAQKERYYLSQNIAKLLTKKYSYFEFPSKPLGNFYNDALHDEYFTSFAIDNVDFICETIQKLFTQDILLVMLDFSIIFFVRREYIIGRLLYYTQARKEHDETMERFYGKYEDMDYETLLSSLDNDYSSWL